MYLCFSSFEWWSVCAIWCRCWWDTSSACRQLCFLPPSHPSSSAITLILFPYQLASVSPVSLSASSGKPFVLLMAFTFLHILFSWLNDCLTVSGRWFISITQVCIWKMECMEREGETVSGIKGGCWLGHFMGHRREHAHWKHSSRKSHDMCPCPPLHRYHPKSWKLGHKWKITSSPIVPEISPKFPVPSWYPFCDKLLFSFFINFYGVAFVTPPPLEQTET